MSHRHFTLETVKVMPPHGLRLHYADGEILTVNLEPLIRQHPSLGPLMDPRVFASASLGDWGAV